MFAFGFLLTTNMFDKKLRSIKMSEAEKNNSSWKMIYHLAKAKLFQEAMFFRHHFFLPQVIIEVQSGNGVLNRLVPFIKCMKIAC